MLKASADLPNTVVRIAFQNTQNYFVEKSDVPDRPQKSEDSIRALVAVCTEVHPDILVLSEMGLPSDFQDFRNRLAKAGLSYPETEYIEAADDSRHVCLLSRFPIIKRNSAANLTFQMNGIQEHYKRGILDVTIEIPGYKFPLRVLATHFKSKRPVPEGEALLRRHEAHLLRKHIDAIFDEDPEIPLILLGDLNELKNEPGVLEVQGVPNDARYLTALNLSDKSGDVWTHYWELADTYSRIDYAMVSKSLLKQIDGSLSGVYRSEHWKKASDHRMIYATIVPSIN